MSDNELLYCLIAFILGWLVSRHMGNGFSVGAAKDQCEYYDEGVTLLLEDKLGMQKSGRKQDLDQIKKARDFAKNKLCPMLNKHMNNHTSYSRYFPEIISYTPKEICETLSIGTCKYNDK